MTGKTPARWSLQAAKAEFSELVRRSLETGPQFVTRNGKDLVVVVSAREFKRLTQPKAESFAQFLARSPLADGALEIVRARDAGRHVKL